MDVFLTLGARSPHRVGCAVAALAFWADEARAGRVSRLIVHEVEPSIQAWLAVSVAGAARGFDVAGVELLRHPRPRAGSQRLRHAWAAAEARTDPYVVCDDDIVLSPGYTVSDEGRPAPPGWTEYAAGLLAENPKLAMLSPIPSPGGLDPSVARAFLERIGASQEQGRALADALRIPTADDHLWRVSGVGGIRVVRRGAIPAEPAALPPTEEIYGGGYDVTLGRWLEDARGLGCAYMVRMQAIHLGYARSSVATVPAFADPAEVAP
jgi:hypothetical protein